MHWHNERQVWVNSISQPLRFFGYAKHHTCKSHELTYHRYKGREVNTKHPVQVSNHRNIRKMVQMN